MSIKAMGLFGEMLAMGLKPNSVAIAGLLPLCGSIEDASDVLAQLPLFGGCYKEWA